VRIRIKLAARSLTGVGGFWVPVLQGDGDRGLPIFALQMRPLAGGGVQVRLAARRGFFEVSSDPIPFAPGTHSLEIVWRPGAEGATLALDGAPRASLTGLPARTLGQIAIGTPGWPIWRSGTLAIDDYESTKA
jgi:hypothetical protein